MQKIAGAFLHLWQGEEFRLWSHLSPLKCAEVTGVVQAPMTLLWRFDFGKSILEFHVKAAKICFFLIWYGRVLFRGCFAHNMRENKFISRIQPKFNRHVNFRF